MAKDTIKFTLMINADFQTIQAMRRLLQNQADHNRLVLDLQDTAHKFLTSAELGDFALAATLSVSRVSETKRAAYPPPLLKDSLVTIWDYDLDRKIQDIAVDGPDWADFLSRPVEISFRYQHPTGFFTAIRENRASGQVWYAHRRFGGKLKRFYLGVPHQLTGDKLADVAQKMSRWAQKSLTV